MFAEEVYQDRKILLDILHCGVSSEIRSQEREIGIQYQKFRIRFSDQSISERNQAHNLRGMTSSHIIFEDTVVNLIVRIYDLFLFFTLLSNCCFVEDIRVT